MSNCQEFELRSVSDDPADREWARGHASACAECAARSAAFAELESAVASWRAAAPEPSPALEARILKLASEPRAAAPLRFPATSRPRAGAVRSLPAWFAAAAGVLLAAGLLLRSDLFSRPAPQTPGALLIERALRDAELAEAAHARAIAQLEQAAAPVLARADDPTLAPRDAALLLSYRDRLRFLDRTVAEVGGFLAENPSHAKARTVLLAAYVEKTEVLREVLALESAVGGHS